MKLSFLSPRKFLKPDRHARLILAKGLSGFGLAVLVAAAGGLTTASVQAQTAVITPITQNYWAGINTSTVLGVGSNAVTFTSPDTSAFNLSVSGQPAGLTTLLTTNVATNTISLGLNLFPTNVAAGFYPLTINGSGGSYASYSTNVNLFVVPQWAITNGGSLNNWSAGASWSSGSAPLTTDSVYFEHMAGVAFTNVVDTSRTIQALIYMGDADDGSSPIGGVNTLIPSSVTLSVLGTNGMYIGCKANNNTRPFYVFSGAGTLVVSNANANFAVNNGCSSSSTRLLTVNMSALSNFVASVSRFGVGDATLSAQGLIGGANVTLSLARTNTIITTWADNYNAINYQNSFDFGNDGEQASGSVTSFLNLGVTNGIYTDSIGVGRSHLQGSSGVGATMRFLPAFSNSVAPFSSVYIRGTNGARLPLLEVGVDSGSANSTKNTIGLVDLRGGLVNVLVDRIWLGSNRTNTAGPTDTGGLNFDNGTVNANIIEAGFMQYTNGALVKGTILVGTNGTLVVNTNLELGHTPADNSVFANSMSASSGLVTINNGGTARFSKVTVGLFSTNNSITVNPGGLLVVSNTIADATKGLTTLSLDGAQVTFSVIANTTNAFMTNLNTTTTASKINIAAAPAGQSTNVLIVYQNANQTPNIGIGSLPAGFNNMQIVVDPVAKTVSLVISTNQPKNLAWRGGANSQWDHSSLNWLDLNTLAITKFTDGDSVTFDDTAAVPTSITIAENVNPGQSGTGILVTNKVNNFAFTNLGSGVIGACTLVKAGTQNLEIDASTSVGAQLNNGTLTVGMGGFVATVTTAAGTTFNNLGTVSGGVTCAGFLSNLGTIIGSLSIQTSGNVSNIGTINSAVAMQSSSMLNNSGLLTAIGNTTVPTNSILINSGTIYGASLTVSANGTLTDTVQGGAGVSPGSINLATLTINGTFNPGGAGNLIGTTKVTDYDYTSGSQIGAPNGRVQLAAGSLTIFKYNSTNVQPYTKVLSQSSVFGPSVTAKSINGCTLLISNVGPTAFAAGQTFKLFGQYYTDGNIGNAGLNTTNSYPNMLPASPGPGLAWDLSQLYPSGTIGIIDRSTINVSLTNSVSFAGGTNIITELTWSPDYNGVGWLQQQTVATTNGLGTNWVNVGASDFVNDILITNTINANTATFYRFVKP